MASILDLLPSSGIFKYYFIWGWVSQEFQGCGLVTSERFRVSPSLFHWKKSREFWQVLLESSLIHSCSSTLTTNTPEILPPSWCPSLILEVLKKHWIYQNTMNEGGRTRFFWFREPQMICQKGCEASNHRCLRETYRKLLVSGGCCHL